jgi:RNA polymerase sigma-70 factor, ECF subfamily
VRCNAATPILVSLTGVGPIPIDLETVTEARLVSDALAGSQSAFEQIVRRYQRPVIGLVTRMVGDPAVAEDLAQEAFVKAFRSLRSFDVTRRLSSWLFRIAHNTALDWLRRTRPALVSLDEETEDGSRQAMTAAAAPPAPDPVETQALGRAIEAAMQALRPAYRAAIALRYEEDLSFEEIGHVLGVPEVTARSYVHRARKELAQALTAVGWQPVRDR